MIKKLIHTISGLINRNSANIDNYDIEPLSPMDVKYIYPVKNIIVKGNKVAYIDEGKGQPVVFVHGVSTTLASFDGLFPEIVKNGYRVIGLDLLGYGKSDKPDIKYSMSFHAETVINLIKQLGLKDTVLVGHSMGAAISTCAMLKEPELFKSMVLLTPGGLAEYSSARILIFKIFYKYIWGKRFSDLVIARKYYHETVYQWSQTMEDFLKTRERLMVHPEWKKVQRTVKYSYASTLQSSKEILPQIESIKKPVLVILADNDNLVPNKEVKANIEKKASHWKIETYEECGHNIQYDQKDRLIKRVLEFLKVCS